MRSAAAILLLALAGCHDEDELTVINTGSESVLVDVDWTHGGDYGWYDHDHHHRLVEVPPGGIFNDEFGFVEDMDVIIYRKSDGLILFAADFDAEDFDDDHGDIEISVTP